MSKAAARENPARMTEAIRNRRAADARRETEKLQDAFDEKTARLRALRLAKEASDREAAQLAAAEKAAAAARVKEALRAATRKARKA
jgi:hypothetical protein